MALQTIKTFNTTNKRVMFSDIITDCKYKTPTTTKKVNEYKFRISDCISGTKHLLVIFPSHILQLTNYHPQNAYPTKMAIIKAAKSATKPQKRA